MGIETRFSRWRCLWPEIFTGNLEFLLMTLEETEISAVNKRKNPRFDYKFMGS